MSLIFTLHHQMHSINLRIMWACAWEHRPGLPVANKQSGKEAGKGVKLYRSSRAPRSSPSWSFILHLVQEKGVRVLLIVSIIATKGLNCNVKFVPLKTLLDPPGSPDTSISRTSELSVAQQACIWNGTSLVGEAAPACCCRHLLYTPGT